MSGQINTGGAHRLNIILHELVKDLIHRSKIVHCRQKDIHLNQVAEIATGFFQNLRYVQQGSLLLDLSA